MGTSGVSKGLCFLILAVLVGGAVVAGNKYHKSQQGRPQSVYTPRIRPASGFGSRATDFADPRKTTLSHVSEYERKQGVRPNVVIGGRR